VPDDQKTSGPNRTEAAYSILKERLFDGTYVPGYRIVINQLVRETGISAIPWREAIRQLEAEGWLETIRHVGPRVATFDADVYEKSVQVLARLEGYVTAVASGRLTAADLATAREINTKMEAALTDFDPISLSTLNREFHFIFYDNCGEEHLNRLIRNEWNRVDLIRRGALRSIPERARDVVREHEALLDLVEADAPLEQIEAAAAEHRLSTLKVLSDRSDG
jgi:DNA-binding GntR family transcriptional regulator